MSAHSRQRGKRASTTGSVCRNGFLLRLIAWAYKARTLKRWLTADSVCRDKPRVQCMQVLNQVILDVGSRPTATVEPRAYSIRARLPDQDVGSRPTLAM